MTERVVSFGRMPPVRIIDVYLFIKLTNSKDRDDIGDDCYITELRLRKKIRHPKVIPWNGIVAPS